MKTFVLFALTLCVAQCEMSHKLFPERGQRSRSRFDQGSHHRPGVSGAGRSIRQFLRRKFGLHRAFPDFRSSSRVARSISPKEHGSGHLEYSYGNVPGPEITLGSGSSSGLGSGFGSGSSLTISLTDQVKIEESQTGKKATHNSIKDSKDNKSESNYSNGEIIKVLTSRNRKKRSADGYPVGSGDTGSGSSGGEMFNIGDAHESSGSEVIEEVIINSELVQIQYAQGGSQSVATSVGSGSVSCIGMGCDQGSGSIELHEAQIELANSENVQNSVTGEDSQSSGMYADAHQP